MGSALGVPEEKILALADYATSPLYDAAERVALEYADAMTLSDREVEDELFDRLRRFYDDDALVELTAVDRVGERVQQVQPGAPRAVAGPLAALAAGAGSPDRPDPGRA